MILKNKFYCPPPSTEMDFKSLMDFAMGRGVGRPCDNQNVSIGPWTTNLLAQAIMDQEDHPKGVDSRTIERWLQSGTRGISPKNVARLAEVFGCGDPDAVLQWRVKLLASRQILQEIQKNKRKTESEIKLSDQVLAEKLRRRKRSLASFVDRLFSEKNLFNLQAVTWGMYVGLGLLHVIMGVHDVTYNPLEGLNKQVGFLWAPNWTLLPLVLVPAYISVLIHLIEYWKREGRVSLLQLGSEETENPEWIEKLQSFNLTFWVVTAICVFFVFGFQWYGLYVRMHLEGDWQGFQIDRNMIALVRPEVISVKGSLVLSMLSFLFIAWYIWLFLIGLTLIIALLSDFSSNAKSQAPVQLDAQGNKIVRNVLQRILISVFHCAVLGILLNTCVKLQVAYLLSDGSNIFDWLSRDALAALGFSEISNGWLHQKTMAAVTTSVMLCATCYVFFLSVRKIRVMQNDLSSQSLARAGWRDLLFMIGVISLMSISMLLVGVIEGFSLLLLISSILAAYAFVFPFHKSRDIARG